MFGKVTDGTDQKDHFFRSFCNFFCTNVCSHQAEANQGMAELETKQGCQFFLNSKYQNGGKYIMTTKYMNQMAV
jgi:hypothetical protein